MAHAAELSDEEMRKLLKPVCTLEQVERAVKKSFGDNIKILKALDSYDDQNFMAEREGAFFLVKVHNGFESRDFIEAYEASGRKYDACTSVIHYQTAVMERLHQHGLPTSQSQLCDGIPLSIHSLPVQSELHSPYQLVVKFMTWVPGRTMASLPSLPIECLRDAGRFLGKMHEALDGMDISQHTVPSQRFHAWDGKNTSRVRDFLSAIDNIEKRAMVESVITAFETDILESGVGEKFPKGILQGDFNDGNILVDENFAISGVIDFGDSVERYVSIAGLCFKLLLVKLESSVGMSKVDRCLRRRRPFRSIHADDFTSTSYIKHGSKAPGSSTLSCLIYFSIMMFMTKAFQHSHTFSLTLSLVGEFSTCRWP